jgi:hypothetical protein
MDDDMVRKVVVAMGYTGYRHQLDRARRFLERVEDAANEVEFQDMVWAFFQNCWHVKDWVQNDPHVGQPSKDAVIARAHQSSALNVCKDLCNGTKHLGARPGPKHQHVEMTIDSSGHAEMDCIIDNGAGKSVSGRALAHQCIGEWVSILQSQGLVTTRSS